MVSPGENKTFSAIALDMYNKGGTVAAKFCPGTSTHFSVLMPLLREGKIAVMGE